MATCMGDVKELWGQVESFKQKDVSDMVRGPSWSPGKLDPFGAYAKAQKLLQNIGKQVCADEGVGWGTDTGGVVNDKTILSQEAEKEFQALRDFVMSQYIKS